MVKKIHNFICFILVFFHRETQYLITKETRMKKEGGYLDLNYGCGTMACIDTMAMVHNVSYCCDVLQALRIWEIC